MTEQSNTVETRPLEELLTGEELSEGFFQDLSRHVFSSPSQLEELSRVLRELKEEDFEAKYSKKTDARTVHGFLFFLNGELERAEELLRHTKNDPWGFYWLVRVTLEMRRWDEAINLAEQAHEKFPEMEPITWLLIEIWLKTGWEKEAEKLLQKLRKRYEGDSRYQMLLGLAAERTGNYQEALENYRRSVEIDPDNVQALFHLGYLSYLHGDEEEALKSYEACTEKQPVYVNALLNLGVVYEDMGKDDEAIRCFHRILEFHPNHAQANMYLRDAEASKHMFFEAERDKHLSKQDQILRTPITDFELSVRSRNCLNKMNVETLGDLIMKTENELLSYKNFGDTSLEEVRNILASKGLRLGQGLEERTEGAKETEEEQQGVDPEVLQRPIESLNLSIRSRRCMDRLKIRTIGDLIQRREVDLMAAKNFGVTSLNEVKEKLKEINLSLRE